MRLVIGSFPGGGIDLVGRIIAQKMSENLRQQVIVDNRGGANGIIGMDLVAKSAPDGYTFYMGTAGHISVNPVIQSKLPFNVDRDFTPVTDVASLPFLVYLHPSLPIKSMAELISHAKANPGALTWSSSADGGLPHLTGELVRLASGIDTRRIPYKGSAPAFNDLLGGRVQYCIDAVSIGLQHVKSGRLLALATTGAATTRHPAERSDVERNAARRGSRQLVRRPAPARRVRRDREASPRRDPEGARQSGRS